MSLGYPLVNVRFKAFVQGTNAPLVAGKVYFYLTGTALATLQDVFSDIECTTPLSNPVILDTNGEAEIFGNAIYDVVVKNSADVTQYTITGVSFSPASSATGTGSQEWLAQTGTLTYISTTSFIIAGNQTAIFTPGRRVQVVVTAGTLYGTVKTSAYVTSTTVVVDLDSGNLDSGLSAVSVGILNAVNTSIPVLALPTMAGGTTAYTIASIQRAPILKGARIQAIINATNTGASTLAVNGGAVTNIKKHGAIALVAGDLQINAIHDFEFDGTNWQLLNPYQTTASQISGGLTGTTTNDNAATGIVGEYLTAQLAIGSKTPLSSTVDKTVISLSLTAGDWEVWGIINFSPDSGSTVIGGVKSGTSLTDNTMGADDTYQAIITASGSFAVNGIQRLITPRQRVSIASTTIVYLIANSNFITDGVHAYGSIFARRMR